MPVLTVFICLCDACADSIYVCVMPVLTVFVCLCDACADSTFGDACTGWMKTTALRCGVRTVCVLCVVCPD